MFNFVNGYPVNKKDTAGSAEAKLKFSIFHVTRNAKIAREII